MAVEFYVKRRLARGRTQRQDPLVRTCETSLQAWSYINNDIEKADRVNHYVQYSPDAIKAYQEARHNGSPM